MKVVAGLVALLCLVVVCQAVSPIERMRFRVAPQKSKQEGAIAPAASGSASASASASAPAAAAASSGAAASASASASASAPAASSSGAAASAASAVSDAASAIVQNAKDKASAAASSGASESGSASYLSVDFDQASENQKVKNLGIPATTSFNPKVIVHAKKVDSELKGNHRAFVKQHAKDCKGSLCPFAAGNKKVEAIAK